MARIIEQQWISPEGLASVVLAELKARQQGLEMEAQVPSVDIFVSDAAYRIMEEITLLK